MGMVTRGKADTYLKLTKAQIDVMTYDDLENDRKNLLNLRNLDYLSEFLRSI